MSYPNVNKDEALQLMADGWQLSRNRRAAIVTLLHPDLSTLEGKSLSAYEFDELLAAGLIEEVPGPGGVFDVYWADYAIAKAKPA